MNRIVSLLLLFFCHPIFGQNINTVNLNPKIISPFSSLGFGEMVPGYYSAAAGMGGLTAGFQDPFNINVMNPAALATLRSTSYEVGLKFKNSKLEEGDKVNKVWTGNLSNLVLAFPLKNPINEAVDRKAPDVGLGFFVGLQPFSEVGYSIQENTNQDKITSASQLLKASGGTYQLKGGLAYRYKKFAIGANMGRLFGETVESKRVTLDSFQNAYAVELSDRYVVNGIVWNAGIQYAINMGGTPSQPKNLVLGIYGNSATNFTTEGTRFYYRENFQNRIDTIVFESGKVRNGKLPASVTVGLMYDYFGKLRYGFDVTHSGWSKYQNEVNPDVLANGYRIAAGLEYIPEILSINSYFDRIRYRVGFHHQLDPRIVKNEQLRETAITIGMGFPLVMPRQQISFVNLAVQAGMMGDKSFLRDQFIRINLGFTLNDNTWFYQRKFN
jgi:hypothetical protein